MDERVKQGRCALLVAPDGAAGALVALGCETRYVAGTEEFGGLLAALCRHALARGADAPDGPEALLDEPWQGGGTLRGALTTTSVELQENLTLVGLRRFALEDGFVGGYVHHDERVGVLAAVRTGAERADAQAFLKRLGMHVAAFPPEVLRREDFPAERVQYEAGGFLLEVRDEAPGLREAWVQSRLARFYAERCLVEQRWVLDESRTVAEATRDALGAGAEVVAFARLALGG